MVPENTGESTNQNSAENKAAANEGSGAPADKTGEQKSTAQDNKSLLGGKEKEGGTGEGKEKPVVPEKYDIKLPDGVKLDEASVALFTPIAQKIGLTNEAAQELVNFDLQRQQKLIEYAREENRKGLESVRGDAEFGGPNFEGTRAAILRAQAKYGDSDLSQGLLDRFIDNWPPLAKFFARVGRDLKEGGTGGAEGKGSSEPPTFESVMYGKQDLPTASG